MVAYIIKDDQVRATLKNNLTLLRALNMAYQNGLFIGASVAVKIIKDRVQNSGISADGQVLFTRSKNPIGAYGQRHGRMRRLKGLQVAKVDLTFTGAMMRSFGINYLRTRSVEVGFQNAKQYEKSQKMEDYYGTDIMTASDDEEAFAIERMEVEVFKVLGQLFT